MQLLERAKKALEARENASEEKKNSQLSEQNALIAEKTKQFEKEFAAEIPLLTEAGIRYRVFMKGIYNHQGYYVLFYKPGDVEQGRGLKMDFNGPGSYRYEYTERERIGTIAFGEWDKEEFLLWVAQGLGLF